LTGTPTVVTSGSLFGEVASVSTAWRTLRAVDEAALEQIASARAKARARAWAAGMDPGFYVIDIDGTLVTAHSPGLGTGSFDGNCPAGWTNGL
jgi:hypothetical protein